MAGLLHFVQLGVASVPITVLLYNCPLLCGFNVPIKGLMTAGEVLLAARVDTHHRHLLLLPHRDTNIKLLSPKADTHFTVPRRVELKMSRSSWLVTYRDGFTRLETVTHLGINRV